MSEIRQLGVAVHYGDGQIWAEVEDMPGCFAAGRDMDELKEALEEAISMYLAPTEADRKRVILEFQPESPKRETRRMPAQIELAPA